VVLEETLQTLANPREMLAEMLRVGRRGMVSFPNFAHWRVLVDLVANGRMPVTEWLPYQWLRDSQHPPLHLAGLARLGPKSGVRSLRLRLREWGGPHARRGTTICTPKKC